MIVTFLFNNFKFKFTKFKLNSAPVSENEVIEVVMDKNSLTNFQRPVLDINSITYVTVSFSVQGLVEIVEKLQNVIIKGYFDIVNFWNYFQFFFINFIFQDWYDEIRVWNNTERLKCIEYLILPSDNDKVWIPFIGITNS